MVPIDGPARVTCSRTYKSVVQRSYCWNWLFWDYQNTFRSHFLKVNKYFSELYRGVVGLNTKYSHCIILYNHIFVLGKHMSISLKGHRCQVTSCKNAIIPHLGKNNIAYWFLTLVHYLPFASEKMEYLSLLDR